MIRTSLSILAFLISEYALSQDYGLWKEVNIPQPITRWSMMDFADSLNGVVLSDSGHYAITSNGGQSWKIDSVQVLGKISSVKFLNRDTFWVVNGTGSNRIPVPLVCYRTVNAGQSFKEVIIPDSLKYITWQQLDFVDYQSIYAVGSLELFKSFDAGNSWASISPKWNDFPTSLSFTDSLHGSVTGLNDFSYNHSGFLKTTFDGGITWDSTNNGAHYFVHYFTSYLGYARGAYVADDLSSPFYELTSDGGKTWIRTSGRILSGVQYESGNNMVFQSSTKLSLKSDSLYSIIDDSMGQISEGIVAFETTSSRHAWLLTSLGRLFKKTDYQTTVKNQLSINDVSTGLDLNNYPNSFSNNTTIRYAIPVDSKVVLEVFDIVGRNVSKLVDQYQFSGIYEVTWNPTGLANGVYYCRLHSGVKTKTIKVLLFQ